MNFFIKKHALFLTFLITSPSPYALKAAAKHPIIIQISPPRSLSTGSMRMWQARNEFTIMNEHFTVAYFIHQKESTAELIDEWYHGSPLRTFEQVYESLIAKAAN